MLPEWYSAWVKTHLTTFGIVTADNIAALGLWWPAFRTLGYDHGELQRATFAVLNGKEQPFKIADHYTALKFAVASERAECSAHDRRKPAGEDRGTCADCGWSGWVIVPHSDFCDAMEWRPTHLNRYGTPVHSTCAVICRCAAGRRFAEKQQAEKLDGSIKPMRMTLDEYEDRVNGNWREQIKWLESKRKELSNAEAVIGDGSKDFIARLVASFAGGKAA